ncbi:MAG: DUF615 domain-containing protein, partial [Proteobacteria bacterium]|nr:DUF615 domain-containing protein [Pseudomonadota bacterium]
LSQDPSSSRPSRTAMKRDMERLQEIGKTLVELSPGKFAKLEMPDNLRAAVTEARRLTAMGALRRQIQYIGRIMEGFDITSLTRGIKTLDHAPRVISVAQTEANDLIKKILLGDDAMLHSIVHAHLDGPKIQELRQLVRRAKKQLTSGQAFATVSAKFAKEFSQFKL